MPFLPPVDLPNRDVANQSVILDTQVSTVTDSKLGNFSILEPGAPYPKSTLSAADYATYGSLLLMRQAATDDPTKMRRVFASLPATQDVDNYDVSYVDDADAFPTFTRRYIELRDQYTKRALNSIFTGLFAVRVTAQGANYTSAPSVSFTGGTGTGAVAISILNAAGGIQRIIVKSEGTTFNGSETVVLTGGGGSGAAAVVIVQPTTCLLKKEEATEQAPPPYDSLCLLVTRVYSTIPGPVLVGVTTTEYGLAMITKQKQSAGFSPTITSATIDASVEPNSAGESTLTSTQYPSIPTGYNYGTTIDTKTNIVIRIRKRRVANGTVGGIFNPPTVAVTNATVANPSVLTLAAPYLLSNQQLILISGDTNTTPSINGQRVVTLIDATHVSIPVNVTSVAGSGFGTIADAAQLYTEIQPLNDRQSIEITSQVDTSSFTGANKSWSEWIQYSWPDVLTTIDSFNDVGTESSNLSGTFEIPTTITWAWGANFNGAVAIRTRRFTGQTQATTSISYSIGPPPLDAVQQICLASGEIVIEGGAFNQHHAISIQTAGTGDQYSIGTSIHYSTVRIENVLTNGFSSDTLASGASLKAGIELRMDNSFPVTFATSTAMTAASVATPTHLTLANPIFVKTGDTITITGDTNTTPSIDGARVATVIDPFHITIPVNVTAVAGSGFGTITGPNTFLAASKVSDGVLGLYMKESQTISIPPNFPGP